MIRLNFLLVIAVTLSTVSCTEGKPPQSQAWSAATGAEAYERLWWKAVQDRDFSTAERRLAPIYTLTTATGIQGKDEALKYFQGLDVSSLSIGDLQVKPEGSDMVVSYVATLQTKATAAPQRFYMTTVWQEVKQGWIAIAHSEVQAIS